MPTATNFTNITGSAIRIATGPANIGNVPAQVIVSIRTGAGGTGGTATSLIAFGNSDVALATGFVVQIPAVTQAFVVEFRLTAGQELWAIAAGAPDNANVSVYINRP